jgi:hypothetical protein
LEQLLRFDATPEWVSRNWSRATTRLAELDLQGWRVPVTIGTNPEDLVGSITYYFDARDQLQRISVHGYTGDAAPILALATGRYQMQNFPSVRGDLYIGTMDGQPLGMLRIAPARVARSQAAGGRFEVLMELNRTGSPYGLSGECRRILQGATVPPSVP